MKLFRYYSFYPTALLFLWCLLRGLSDEYLFSIWEDDVLGFFSKVELTISSTIVHGFITSEFFIVLVFSFAALMIEISYRPLPSKPDPIEGKIEEILRK